MRRGEIWWANLPAAIGRRPVLLLSRDAAYAMRASVTVAPVTRTVHDIPAEVHLGPEDGLPAPCVVNLDSILTIPKRSLDHSLTLLSTRKLIEIKEAIQFGLDLH